jgi:hypothetical protein
LNDHDEHWTSLPAQKHTFIFEIQFKKLDHITVTFQGGFSARKGQLSAKNKGGEWTAYGKPLYFNDTSSPQLVNIIQNDTNVDDNIVSNEQRKQSENANLELSGSQSNHFILLKMEMMECADIHGRVTVYNMQVDGTPA